MTPNQNPEQTALAITVSRNFAAPREIVFEAWSSADHMKRWFCPADFIVPEATVDFRAGGTCDVCMRSPDGVDYWSRGHYIEVAPPERLMFETSAMFGGTKGFTARTSVTFESRGTGTHMTVHQSYEVHDPKFMGAISGAPEGWRTTLDKLEKEVARIRGA